MPVKGMSPSPGDQAAAALTTPDAPQFRNFSRNRPETTNLSHQYAIRRVLICAVLEEGSPTGRIVINAEPPGAM